MSEQKTKWTNPTEQSQHLRFNLESARIERRMTVSGEELTKVTPATYLDFEIPPGQTVEIPSIYDGAIHRRDAAGTVIAGAAPLLIREGQTYGILACLIPAPDPHPSSVAVGDIARRLRDASAPAAAAADPETTRMAAIRAKRAVR